MHTNNGNSRRAFFKQVIAGSSVLLAGMYAACRPRSPLAHIKGGIVGANFSTGHILHNIEALPAPVRTVTTDVLIIGGGISGLSAKRWLQKQGHTDVMLIEMDDHFGGNSTYGKNATSAYPWAAHYLPIPDVRNKEILELLQETGTITGYDDKGLPVYNDYHLCNDPEERLLINGYWQEGLVPEVGVPVAEKEQIKRFFKTVNDYKLAIGSDGKDAFAIPVDNSSADEQYRQLDKLSFHDYLQREGYTSKYLLWYLEYGCKDDYGSILKTTSAWAGLHYFASRKGTAANTNSSGVLTWPEGNGFLMEHIRKQVSDSGMFKGQLACKVEDVDGHTKVMVYDVAKKESYTICAKKIIMATPQLVNLRLLKNIEKRLDDFNPRIEFRYAPWVIANITVSNLPEGKGTPLCWDNVVYGSASVGYVNANHQNEGIKNKVVLTHYLPLANESVDAARQNARNKTYDQWLKIFIDELEYAHPGITEHIEATDIWVWGHGMIAPSPGFMWGQARSMAARPIGNKIFFAHSDLSGISIFEEAFYQGIKAAKQVIASL